MDRNAIVGQRPSRVYLHAGGTLSSNGINVVETMSSYTDTIFIVQPEDMMRAFEILSKSIEE